MCDLNRACRLPRDAKQPTQPPMPDFYMPAMPPLKLINALENWVRSWVRRRQFRQRFLYLLDYDDHILADMGHCREEIEWALQLPLREDAIKALSCRRERRRQASSIGNSGNGANRVTLSEHS
ncbi:hypothetical protein SAMN05661010_03783 [Modicisalibacter muralis]|uniref:DUF1127 domain-containing protein n=1 Tax=Modicisalibacter muralis TaxID=119000 RepID=A0A1G9RSF7_9GAMM|nr:hypothetical protein [Halomonas muralis]SDM26113.1 hypothetical protein SAMN05661010_03783 [Halomonas muralis]